MIVDNNDNNNNGGNKGNKGKFSERLKKMRRDRLKIRKNGSLADDDKLTLKDTGRNIFKIILALPNVVYTHIVDKKEDKDNKVVNSSDNIIGEKISSLEKIDDSTEKVKFNSNIVVKEKDVVLNEEKRILSDSSTLYSNDKKEESDLVKGIKVNKIREIDISLLKRQLNSLPRKSIESSTDVDDVLKNAELEVRKVKLQKEVLDLIKKRLVKNINELEILQSELYVLNELEVGDTYLDECQQDIKEIKKLLSKVKSLKEKYDFLKENVDFEYMLEYGDDFLVDKILELKEICTRDDIKKTIDDYKILEEYKFLYLKIDKLQDDMVKFEDDKTKKAEELKERDINFDKLKDNIYDVDRENERYEGFVQKQQLFLNELEEKVSKIDSYEKVTYRLKGFNQLLGNSFKYLGLLLINPLKGLIPGIATQTVVTKNVVHNLYNNLEWEENRRMIYEAVDYSTSINSAINNLDDTSSLVNSTLDDVIRLKRKYKKEFGKYEGSFSSYNDAIKKLNKIENAVLGNKIKIDMMKTRMKEKERQNSSKLKMVKKLNGSNK